jgi:hypothetical protein
LSEIQEDAVTAASAQVSSTEWATGPSLKDKDANGDEEVQTALEA